MNVNETLIHLLKSDRFELSLIYFKRRLLWFQGHLNDQNSSGNTVLHWAVHRNKSDIVKLLLDNGANVNIANKYKQHPLFWSVNSDLKIQKMLLDKGSSLLRKDIFGNTIFNYYFSKGSLDLMRNLLKMKRSKGLFKDKDRKRHE